AFKRAAAEQVRGVVGEGRVLAGVPAGEQDLEGVRAEQQRRGEQVLFVPQPRDMAADVVVRQVDVVDLDDHARLQARQDVEEEGGDVRALEGAVGGIQEEDVA